MFTKLGSSLQNIASSFNPGSIPLVGKRVSDIINFTETTAKLANQVERQVLVGGGGTPPASGQLACCQLAHHVDHRQMQQPNAPSITAKGTIVVPAGSYTDINNLLTHINSAIASTTLTGTGRQTPRCLRG